MTSCETIWELLEHKAAGQALTSEEESALAEHLELSCSECGEYQRWLKEAKKHLVPEARRISDVDWAEMESLVRSALIGPSRRRLVRRVVSVALLVFMALELGEYWALTFLAGAILGEVPDMFSKIRLKRRIVQRWEENRSALVHMAKSQTQMEGGLCIVGAFLLVIGAILLSLFALVAADSIPPLAVAGLLVALALWNIFVRLRLTRRLSRRLKQTAQTYLGNESP